MKPRYEYKFIRLGEGWFRLKKAAREQYKDVVREHAKDGWRLVQLFAPSLGWYGESTYIDVVLERETK